MTQGGERAPRRRAWAGIAVSFLALAALWLWTGRGGSALIRIVVAGDTVKVFLDGTRIAEGVDASLPPDGGVAVWYDRDPYWGIPGPQTLRAMRVTDTDTGAVLLYQDFSRPLSALWTERPEKWTQSSEGLRGDRARPMRLATGALPWRNYTLDLTVRNLMAIEVAVRYRDRANLAEFWARPFRELDSGITFVHDGARRNVGGEKPSYAARAVAKNIARLFIYWFPLVAAALLVLAAVGRIAGFAAARIRVPVGAVEALFLAALFAGAFVYLSWITRSLLEEIPHVQDSVVYSFQARTLARGALYSPAPPVPQAFDFDFLIVKDGKWFGQYPWGHPFLLMFGYLAGAPWIIPPLVGASVLVLVYLIARELFSREVAAVSALLAFSSPFFQVNAPNFMSHSSASFYLALGIYSLIRSSRGGRGWWGLLAGLSLGLLFNTRPLNALPALALSLGILLYFVFRGRASWRSLLGFCVGGGLTLAFFLYANYVLMGHPFHAPYTVAGNSLSLFGPKNPPGPALLNYYTSMCLFVMTIFGWPPVFTAGLFLAYLLLGRKDAWGAFLVLVFAGMTAVNILYTSMSSPGHMYGPRYVYEPFFVYVIMAAAGWDAVRRLIEGGIARGAAAFPLRARVLAGFAHALCLVLLAALVATTQQKWLSRGGGLFNFAFMPSTVFGMKGFNYVSGAMRAKIRDCGIRHALLFLDEREPDWWYYGALFTLNSPFLDSEIVVARDRGPEENRKLIAAFPGRRLFRVSVKRQEIRDY